MKKTLVFGTATAVVAALSLGMCAASQMAEPALYGPPPDDVVNVDDDIDDEEDDPVEDIYGAPIDEGDDDEEVVALYGPPPDLESTAVDEG